VDESESIRRDRRKGSYHLLASKNRLPSDPDDQEEDYMFKYLLEPSCRKENALAAKRALLEDIATSGGDTTTASFQRSLEQLVQLSRGERSFDARQKPSKTPKMEGMWISLSKPQFSDSIGRNEHLEQMYTLGRMSFGKFNFFFIELPRLFKIQDCKSLFGCKFPVFLRHVRAMRTGL
jgi:hypothetical protein